jgi:protein ImuB
VGAENVGVAEIENSHRPDAVKLVAPRFHQLAPEASSAETARAIGLPLRRFRPPVGAQVRTLSQRPTEIFSAPATGVVTDALGPYRASGAWWEHDRWGVEEWDVEIADHGLYRLRCENSNWLVEGCYDAGVR